MQGENSGLASMERIGNFILNLNELASKSEIEKVCFRVKPTDHFNLKRFEFLSKFYSFFSIPVEFLSPTSQGPTDASGKIIIFDYKFSISTSTRYSCSAGNGGEAQLGRYCDSCSTFLDEMRVDSGNENSHIHQSDNKLFIDSCLLFDLFDKKMQNWNRPVSFAKDPSSSSTHPALYCQYTMARIEGIMRNSPQILPLLEQIHRTNQINYTALQHETEHKLAQMILIIENLEQCQSLLAQCIEAPQKLARCINQFNATCHHVGKYISCARVKDSNPRQPELSLNEIRGLFLLTVLHRMSNFWQAFGLFHVKFM